MKLKLLAFAFILAFAISTFGALGASGASAGLTLTTGLLSPQGTNVVSGPAEATGGAVTAFTAITGDPQPVIIENVDITFVC